METVVLYEVYPKRALQEPISGLVILDRTTAIQKAKTSARRWGGVVARVEARIVSKYPMVRVILKSEIVFVHKPRKASNQQRDQITRKQLMGKIRQNKPLYRSRKN